MLNRKRTILIDKSCDTEVRPQYLLHVTSPVSHLTQIFHHTHGSPFPGLHTLWFSETLYVSMSYILVVNTAP